MSSYVLAYFGEPTFASSEEGNTYKAKWRAWVGGLGEALINPAIPLRAPKIVRASGVSDGARSDRLTGFSIAKADSMDAAVEMAKGCPHLEHGTIEVSEVMEM